MNENERYVDSVRDHIREAYEASNVTEEWDENPLYKYLMDNELDVEYRVSSDLEYQNIYIYITLGGPTVWIDTHQGTVEYNDAGGNRATSYLAYAWRDAIDDYYREIYNAQR